jgi:hypothetical protein
MHDGNNLQVTNLTHTSTPVLSGISMHGNLQGGFQTRAVESGIIQKPIFPALAS